MKGLMHGELILGTNGNHEHNRLLLDEDFTIK